jgi:hypothetical protein
VLDYQAASDYREGLAWCYVDLALAQEAAGLPAEAAASRGRGAEIRANVSQSEASSSGQAATRRAIPGG